jgi:hypothetical protein
MTQPGPFKHFKTSPEIFRLAVMLYVRFPLSPSGVVSVLHKGQPRCQASRGMGASAAHG